MSRTLILFRHGKSSWEQPLPNDYDRPLKKRGKRDSENMGAWLAAEDLKPDMVLSSTAKRAAQTTRRVCAAMDFPEMRVEWHEDLYEAGIFNILSRLHNIPSTAQRVMLVGHNPGLEDVAFYISQTPLAVPDDGKFIPTATAAVFQFDCAWAELDRTMAALVRVQRPKWLAAST